MPPIGLFLLWINRTKADNFKGLFAFIQHRFTSWRNPGGQFLLRLFFGGVLSVGLVKTTGHAFAHFVALIVGEHHGFIHFVALRADHAGNKAARALVRLLSQQATSSTMMPEWRNRGSTDGLRPRKFSNSSAASEEPPWLRISRRKLSPVSRLKMPSSSKREKASALSTSAHL